MVRQGIGDAQTHEAAVFGHQVTNDHRPRPASAQEGFLTRGNPNQTLEERNTRAHFGDAVRYAFPPDFRRSLHEHRTTVAVDEKLRDNWSARKLSGAHQPLHGGLDACSHDIGELGGVGVAHFGKHRALGRHLLGDGYGNVASVVYEAQDGDLSAFDKFFHEERRVIFAHIAQKHTHVRGATQNADSELRVPDGRANNEGTLCPYQRHSLLAVPPAIGSWYHDTVPGEELFESALVAEKPDGSDRGARSPEARCQSGRGNAGGSERTRCHADHAAARKLSAQDTPDPRGAIRPHLEAGVGVLKTGRAGAAVDRDHA